MSPGSLTLFYSSSALLLPLCRCPNRIHQLYPTEFRTLDIVLSIKCSHYYEFRFSKDPNKEKKHLNSLHAGIFSWIFGRWFFFQNHNWFFFQNQPFRKIIIHFFEWHQRVKQFGSRSGPTFCRTWSGSKLFAKIISRTQQAHTVETTSNQYRCDVTTSHRRLSDVVFTLCVHWEDTYWSVEWVHFQF